MSLETLLKDMEHTEKIREDLNIPMSSLMMWDDGTITNRTYGELIPSDVTMSKLCKMYGLSHSHIKKLAEENRYDLIAAQFNHFLEKDYRVMMLRLVGDRIKGIVPKDYQKFDDYNVFSQVNSYLTNLGLDYDMKKINRDDEYTRLRFMFEDTAENMGIAEETGTEDMVKGGFEITNSEIGLNGMSVNSLVYRQVCSNGMMDWAGDDENKEIFYKRGNNFNPFSRTHLLENAMSNAVTKSAENIALFKKTKGLPVDEPMNELRRIGRKYKLGSANVESVKDKFKIEPQPNYFGIINSITRCATDQYKNDYRSRSKLEFAANEVLKEVTCS